MSEITQLDHQFFFLSHKAKCVWYCLISPNSCWEITGFHWQVRAQLCILQASVNTKLISSGTVGRIFFPCHQIGAINCVWGLSHRVSGVHLQSSAAALWQVVGMCWGYTLVFRRLHFLAGRSAWWLQSKGFVEIMMNEGWSFLIAWVVRGWCLFSSTLNLHKIGHNTISGTACNCLRVRECTLVAIPWQVVT